MGISGTKSRLEKIHHACTIVGNCPDLFNRSVAEMEMDTLDFNNFVSGRFSYEEGMKRARISGERHLIETAFRNLLLL